MTHPAVAKPALLQGNATLDALPQPTEQNGTPAPVTGKALIFWDPKAPPKTK